MTNFISYAEAEELCDELIQQYIGKDVQKPISVDIDGFVREILQCTIRYEDIYEDDPGKTGFACDGVAALRIRRNGVVESVVFPRNTIVLDQRLLYGDEAHRRFVVSHEAGHILAGRINPASPACFHRTYDKERSYTLDELKELCSVSEWQANTIGAALLMPRFLMQQTLEQHNGGRKIPVYGNAVFHPREKVILHKMAAALRVSHTALVIRLRDLNMLSPHDISEYVTKELGLGGVSP